MSYVPLQVVSNQKTVSVPFTGGLGIQEEVDIVFTASSGSPTLVIICSVYIGPGAGGAASTNSESLSGGLTEICFTHSSFENGPSFGAWVGASASGTYKFKIQCVNNNVPGTFAFFGLAVCAVEYGFPTVGVVQTFDQTRQYSAAAVVLSITDSISRAVQVTVDQGNGATGSWNDKGYVLLDLLPSGAGSDYLVVAGMGDGVDPETLVRPVLNHPTAKYPGIFVNEVQDDPGGSGTDTLWYWDQLQAIQLNVIPQVFVVT